MTKSEREEDFEERFKYEAALESGKFEVNTRDLLGELEKIHMGGVDRGISTGFPSLDPFYRVRKGEICVVTGIPGHGKSSFVDALLMSLAVRHGWKFSMFSPENEPYQLHLRKLVELHSGEALFKECDDGTVERMSGPSLTASLKFIHDKFYWVNTKDSTLPKVMDVWASHIKKYNVDGVILDPWNEIIPTPPEGMNETQYINMCLMNLRMFATENQVAMWIVAHPTKLYRNKEGNFPVPSLNDISGSAAWRAKAHIGIVVYRESSAENELDILIQKVKFKTSGKPGRVRMHYDYDSGRLS